MKLITISSGSKGNCYLLENDKECLIIEAGVRPQIIFKHLDFNLRKITGCVVSHKHSDHAKYINELKARGIPVFTPYLNESLQKRNYGNFIIESFPLEHDVPNFGFLIKHKDIGNFLYITDTSYCKYKFKHLNAILIECNHDVNMLNEEAANFEHSFAHHMSLQTCKEFIQANNNVFLDKVILCHMSDTNINEEQAATEISTVVEAKVYSAHTNKEIDVSLIPF